MQPIDIIAWDGCGASGSSAAGITGGKFNEHKSNERIGGFFRDQGTGLTVFPVSKTGTDKFFTGVNQLAGFADKFHSVKSTAAGLGRNFKMVQLNLEGTILEQCQVIYKARGRHNYYTTNNLIKKNVYILQ